MKDTGSWLSGGKAAHRPSTAAENRKGAGRQQGCSSTLLRTGAAVRACAASAARRAARQVQLQVGARARGVTGGARLDHFHRLSHLAVAVAVARTRRRNLVAASALGSRWLLHPEAKRRLNREQGGSIVPPLRSNERANTHMCRHAASASAQQMCPAARSPAQWRSAPTRRRQRACPPLRL